MSDKTKQAVDVFNRRAEAYQEKFMDVSFYADALEIFCKGITRQNAAVLDIGCGPGNIIRYLLDRRPDLAITGIDLAPKMLELASINNPAATFLQMDCRDIRTLGTTFDGIVCGFCLPYLSQQEAAMLIADAAALLLPGGMFYLSAMEDDYKSSGMQTSSQGDRLYVYYHEAEHLLRCLAENGFSVLRTEHKEYKTGEVKMTDVMIVAVKNELKPFATN